MKKTFFKFRSLFILLILALTTSLSKGQTFNCYSANNVMVLPTVLEFDVYIVSTSTDFSFRTAQFCFAFNPSFAPPSGTATASMVSGSSDMNNYAPVTFTTATNMDGFQVNANTGVNCATGTLVSTTPLRIARFRFTSTMPFGSSSPDVKMIRITDTHPAGLALSMSVSKWDDINCAVGTNTIITAGGTFYNIATHVNDIAGAAFETQVYPNPATDNLTVKFKSKTDATYFLTLLDVVDRLVMTDNVEAKSGQNFHQLDLSKLAKGAYILKIEQGSFFDSVRVTVN